MTAFRHGNHCERAPEPDGGMLGLSLFCVTVGVVVVLALVAMICAR